MILYLDTSALVKIYVTEASSREVLTVFKRAKVVASHLFAYVEANAAFSRLKRENNLSERGYETVKKSFAEDWENYLKIDNTQTLMQRAVDLADAFALRAYDSVHLAAADMLSKQSKQAVTFACFDRQLNKAAKVLGLDVIEAISSSKKPSTGKE